MVDRIKASIRTDFDRVVNPSRYGENARVNTVGQYAGTAIIAGTIGSTTAWRYGLQYSPYIGTFIGEAAFDYWGTGQPGWFVLLDEIRSWLERLNNWREKNCANN